MIGEGGKRIDRPAMGVVAIGLWRLRVAVTSSPAPAGLRATVVLAGLFAAYAIPMALWTELILPALATPVGPELAVLATRTLLIPSLLEELLFRGLLIPHRSERVGWRAVWGWSALSLTLYLAAHPLLAWTLRPDTLEVFGRPSFLVAVALLGVTTTVAYRQSGSLWPSVAIHWLAVATWLSLGGRVLLFG